MNCEKILSDMINDEKFKLKYFNLFYNRSDTIPSKIYYSDESIKTLKRLNALYYARWILSKK